MIEFMTNTNFNFVSKFKLQKNFSLFGFELSKNVLNEHEITDRFINDIQ